MGITLELTEQRRIAIQQHGHRYTFTCSRITPEQWLRYFTNIVSTSEQKGDEQVRVFDTSSAGLKLLDEVLLDAEGYAGSSVKETLNWKEKIPLSHRRAVFGALVNVQTVNAAADEPLALGLETVALQALWSADGDGGMVLHGHLRHHFNTPTFEHNRRYMREASRSVIVGGSRTGKTVWRGAQRELVAIYDELIDSVEGYSIDGRTDFLCEDVVANMDTFHKVVAASALFDVAEAATAEAEVTEE